ncbi:MAG TPA: hypothetical protein VMD28_02355 [Acidimicrobiales bacterium]|nr:hypothetical protein [Acidimicrobiales bacterium]
MTCHTIPLREEALGGDIVTVARGTGRSCVAAAAVDALAEEGGRRGDAAIAVRIGCISAS